MSADTEIPNSTNSGLLTTYKKYKEDTEIVAGWLRANAIKHGFKFGDRAHLAIRTSDFIPMAEAIVAGMKKGQFIIHPAIDGAFRRAITARTKVTEWYAKHFHPHVNTESNSRHTYFTNILCKTWGILLNASAAGHPKDTPKKALAATNTGNSSIDPSIFNKFSALALEHLDLDGDSDVEDTRPTTKPAAQKKGKKAKDTFTPATVLADDEQKEEEYWFALHSFFTELHKIRSIVKQYWTDYKDGKIDLIMAALGTNTAIDLIRRSEIELDTRVVRPRRFPEDKYPVWKFPAMLNAHLQSKKLGKERDDVSNQWTDSVISPWMAIDSNYIAEPSNCHHNNFSLYTIYLMLATWQQSLKKEKRELKTDSFCQQGCTDCDWVNLKLFLAQFTAIITIHASSTPWEDEITRGIRHVITTQQIPIWAVFGSRVLLDVHAVLGLCSTRPREEVAYHIEKVWQDGNFDEAVCEETSQDTLWPCEGQYRAVLDGLPLFKSNVRAAREWVIDDVLEARDETAKVPIRPSIFLHANPLHCGLIKYDLYRSRQCGAYRQNQPEHFTPFLWPTMHIYMACRAVFPDTPAWPDMEFLIYQQGVEHLFVGGRPRSLEECFKRWLLAQGYSAAAIKDWKALEKQYAVTKGGCYNKKGRPMKDTSVVGNFFQSRAHARQEHYQSAHDSFQDMIQKMHTQPRLARLAAQIHRDSSATEKTKFVDKWAERLHKWTIAEILELTQMYLSVDMADIGFNAASLNETCVEMWRAAAKRYIIPGDHKSGPVILTTCCICDVALSEKTAKKRRVPVAEVLQQTSPFFMAMQRLIQEHCEKRTDIPGTLRGFAAERCLAALLSMNEGDAPYPTEVVADYVGGFFQGWSPEAMEQSASHALAKKFLEKRGV